MPVRITVGPHTTAPPRTAQAVCWVRSTQMVSADPGTAHLARSASVLLVAIRPATLAVDGPARPWAGLIPYRAWNFLIAAQSAADCTPSSVTGPYPPSCANAASTGRCRSPCGQPAGAAEVGAFAGTESEGRGAGSDVVAAGDGGLAADGGPVGPGGALSPELPPGAAEG